MDKKMYFAPEFEELEMLTEGFLCASTDLDEGDVIPGMDKNDDEEGDGF